jgi:hypothetical protein
LPPPRFTDLRRFCEIDGWEELQDALGRTGDYRRYRNVLDDGTILRTRMSHGSGEIANPELWTRIWRHQLGLEKEEDFWHAVRTGRPVPRGAAPPVPPAGPTTPGWVVAGLIRAGRSESEIRSLTADEATQLLREIWAGRRD